MCTECGAREVLAGWCSGLLAAAGWNVRLVGKIGICSAFGHGQRLDKILQTLRGLFQSRRS